MQRKRRKSWTASAIAGLSALSLLFFRWAHGMAETIPFDPDDWEKEPFDDYGKDKLASEMYLREQYRKNGFPATIVMPGQISGPGWTIINPWGNTSIRVFQEIADGKEIALPNFGQRFSTMSTATTWRRYFIRPSFTEIGRWAKP